MNTIGDRNMSLLDWTAQTGLLLARFGTVPTLIDETRWQQWARTVCSLPAIAAVSPPHPEGFADWRLWARRFNQAVEVIPI